jgi:hypothetical protein
VESSGTSRFALDGEAREALDDQPAADTSKAGAPEIDDLSLTRPDVNQTEDLVELLQGTEMEASEAAQSTLTSAGVGMPSAEMIKAAEASDDLEGEAKTTGEVDRVIADALEGGADNGNIDAVIDALANQDGGGNAAIEALASPVDADVSAWHTPGLGGFTGAKGSLTMETMELHPDAVQAA